MMKLTHTQAAVVAELCTEYADYKFAISNGDDAMIVHHGARTLERCTMLGFSKLLRHVKQNVEQSMSRLGKEKVHD